MFSQSFLATSLFYKLFCKNKINISEEDILLKNYLNRYTIARGNEIITKYFLVPVQNKWFLWPF